MINSLTRLSFLFLLLLLCGFSWTKIDWDSINNSINRKYPEVASITTDELKEKLDHHAHLTIIDVRDPDEFKVSQIPTAINQMNAKKIELPKDSTIIAYCSVGLRSADFAEKLAARGYTQVFNLKGSIFEWANKGYPLHRDGKTVTVVHPYNKKWGKLLNSDLHTYKVDD
jgi:rhodanese-related sulfurtransferase